MATSYPRPDFERKSLNWVSPNGVWDFLFDDGNEGLANEWPKKGIPPNTAHNQSKLEIEVPYAFQPAASGGVRNRVARRPRSDVIAVTGRSPQGICAVEIEVLLIGSSVVTKEAELPKERDLVAFDLDMKLDDIAGFQTTAPYDQEGVWLNGIALWAPEHPILYDLVLRLRNGSGNQVDEVHTTVGMHSLSWQSGDGTFRLNGKPLF
ncbi:hypothetical protein N7539_001149 [Penicillium diatomitis]|uniref:Glycoside hydrolase family 2 immunoglobulin-like beta-sandwich domain-containing protein n=1 Tax=Penicillium diatomitis TaxID=2819901 RepID=A0A9W9XN81_9EURO|nr:uncharacterized protein N7539_001149 [Penicillium diatomitis]KAJ5496033.1 hypothetical protein N7539_001149 [Penicillium diatomitis]